MRIPTRGREGGLKFNLTPLIDVVFNLIIFFLAASHFAQSEAVDRVLLPDARSGNPDAPEARPRVIVTIPSEGTYIVGGKNHDLAAIEKLFAAEQERLRKQSVPHPELEVRIRTDRRVPYRVVEPLLIACARNGIREIKFAVIPVSGNSARDTRIEN